MFTSPKKKDVYIPEANRRLHPWSKKYIYIPEAKKSFTFPKQKRHFHPQRLLHPERKRRLHPRGKKTFRSSKIKHLHPRSKKPVYIHKAKRHLHPQSKKDVYIPEAKKTFILVFPTWQDSATFWDKGTEVPLLTQDKGKTGWAQNLAKGRDGPRQPVKTWDVGRDNHHFFVKIRDGTWTGKLLIFFQWFPVLQHLFHFRRYFSCFRTSFSILECPLPVLEHLFSCFSFF